jgi:hypothetical protein
MKLGVVVVNRNDGYKDFERGIIHFKSMVNTFDEVNYIDWNSPETSYLWEIKDKLPKTGKIRHYVIAPEIVSQLIPYPNASKCNETLSRNIAIKRSDADWIVSTSLDIIPPKREDLIETIETLDKNTFYTISRREAPLPIIKKYTTDEWSLLREELYNTIPERYYPAAVSPNDKYSLINCCGDFQLAHRDLWHAIKGFEENMVYTCFSDTNVQKKAVLGGFNLEALYNPPLFHMEHEPYSVTEKGERVKSETFHESSKAMVYNDMWDYVECFQKTSNSDSWGLNNTEIEFEIF